ncbi:Inositolphosphorylceramide synthase subunit Kei1-domain-containing protein [Lyophyllum atratum]|nr:Inositolphosphorylceramide synthase subunit Kei1-domain-containing protein [Lyophyllum atratum]
MLRPEWRLWPLSSFLGFLDLKTGVTVALLFALLNKVAGVYGLIAMVTGAGGSFAQLSLYLYSVIALVGLVWGLRAVKEEDPKQTLYFAHLFFADHIFSTAWTIFFAVIWWVYTPHDGRRTANSPAQQAMMDIGKVNSTLTAAQREAAAMEIWNHEKGTAAAVIVISWLSKIYFAILIYSYASHLRKGSYRSLPLSKPTTEQRQQFSKSCLRDKDVEDFYRVPLRAHKAGNGSMSGMAEFVKAPGRRTRQSSGSRSGSRNGHRIRDEENVLFDEDASTVYASSSRGHSKMGTEEDTIIGTDDERGSGAKSRV